MKKVEYMGQVFEVPDWARFIVNEVGNLIFVYETHPDNGILNSRFEKVGRMSNCRYVKEC